ncbi:uncharacterized protein BCR38DRAFT_23120 [Pseudomassariella vexata]|uniref:Methyltransferase type 11 domain-containing protein n=1 Tax=Pseudomassariella vexata TaxID=1141098 RepID=A0A1Y2EKT8_9PEZI|nr:uncharacterized protein BCR38DRAFT_23120 [Pseudomassariella vexata]ORY71916.1 hypothetical protein BCR38DRAFT_23120 [Pseudomassariella vexata]
MASIRPRSDLRSRAGDASRSKRMGGYMETSKEDFPPTLTRIARREADSGNRQGASLNAQPKTQSRIPQNPSMRKPPGSSSRPPLTHETRPTGSTGFSFGRAAPATLSPVMPSIQDRDAVSRQSHGVLRRKQSSVSREIGSLRDYSRSNSGKNTSSSCIPRAQAFLDPYVSHLNRGVTECPVEVKLAQVIELPKAVAQSSTTIYPELDRYRDIEIPRNSPGTDGLFRLATHDLLPPTPLFSGTSSHSQLSTFSGSPSTRFSESPGPGPYSRDTTPTSMSSASPGLVAPLRNAASKVKQASPAERRPPVTRRRAGSIPTDSDGFGTDSHGLAVVREALTSSSSNSTVRDADNKEKKKKKALAQLPAPKPPPRKSSQKFNKDRDVDESPSKPAQTPAHPVMRSPSPIKSDNSHRPFTSPQPRPTPPSRPSRDGTPDLYSQFGGPLPVIHSNLSASSVPDRRQSAQLAPSSLPRSTTPSSSQDRPNASRLPVNREPTPAPLSASALGAQPAKTESRRATRTPSPSVTTFKSRFGLFGRRTKTESDVPQVDKKDKSARKGPAAGTGHEGYGRIGTVRRRSSHAPTPRGLGGPVSSSESLASTQSTDPFLLERMNPVVIAGGEIIENRNASSELSRTNSDQSLPPPGPSIDSRNRSSMSLSTKDGGVGARHTLWPSPFPRTSVHSRRPSDSSDSEAVTMKSTLAFRRSIQRLRSSPDQEPMKLPKPIVTRSITMPSVVSMDTAIYTDDSVVSQPEVGRGRGAKDAAPRKLVKRAKSPRKWNLFSRSQSQPATEPKKKKGDSATVAAAVKAVPRKPVPFYAIMDSSEQEDMSDPDLTDILREAQGLAPPSSVVNRHERRPSASSQRKEQQPPPLEPRQAVRPQPVQNAPAQVQTTTIAKPNQARPFDSQVPATKTTGRSAVRPSRLPQVGRIPKVVNTRPEQTSPKSFSRPFNRISLQLQPPPQIQVDQDSVAKGPSPPKPSTPELSRDEPTATIVTNNSPKNRSPAQGPSMDCSRPEEFFAFAPRKNSDYTTSSCSSISAAPAFANHTTAVVPEPTAPLAEDEIWDEYNDLLGDVPPSATSSRGMAFHLEKYETKVVKKISKPLESPTIKVQSAKDTRDSCDTGEVATSSSHFSADMTARINAAFHFGAEPPSTPFSVSEFVSGYGERNKSSAEVAKPRAASQSSSSSPRESATARISASSSASEETPLSQVNLRVGSMTVSKWLTFGHVLFSPVREDLLQVVGSLKRHSILVIDGLGNDDWSFYAAETYPAATFFNLSPRAPISQEHRSSDSFPLTPPNHHQIQYNSHMEKFPFGAESFTSVVFRFPSAAPEAHYRNIMSEARRVLKPGGYIELSILDVDLNNMGNRTRRAVRRLKEIVNIKNPDLNLSSTADLVLRLLGKMGFVDVKTCRVGIPVASAIANSGSEGGKKKGKDERSLAEMMNDETTMGDENITKMVAKVGRWWYNRLYETATGTNASIWNDKALLAECEEWETTLKLMVCHAKVPETRGRVSSI